MKKLKCIIIMKIIRNKLKIKMIQKNMKNVFIQIIITYRKIYNSKFRTKKMNMNMGKKKTLMIMMISIWKMKNKKRKINSFKNYYFPTIKQFQIRNKN